MSVCVQLLLYKRVVVVDGVVFMHLDRSAQQLHYVSQSPYQQFTVIVKSKVINFSDGM